MKNAGLLLFWGLMAYAGFELLDSCGILPAFAPKLISADGQTYTACSGMVRVTGDGGLLGGGTSYTLSYTDASGLKHTLHGVKTVEISDVPALVQAPFPTTDELSPTTTSDGKPYTDGLVYTWTDGNKARRENGQWRVVLVPNPLCPKS